MKQNHHGGIGNNPLNLSKKKGFTLIELLAVIVILAVIALIAVLTILNIIEKSKKGAAMASADSYTKAVETYILTSQLDHQLEKLKKNETYNTSKINELVEVKGTKPQTGEITVGEKGNITSAELTISGYIIKYDGEEYTIIGKDNNIYAQSITIEKEKEEINVGETISLKAVIQPSNATDKTVTWTSSDTSVATISSSGLVTGIKGGTVTLTAKTSNNKSVTVSIKVAGQTFLLSDKVSVGDYVDYDAGTWTSTVQKPSVHGAFGGYTSGTNKGSSVSWCDTSNKTTHLKGWRVLSKSNTTVTLVHAGIPECYYHGTESSSASVTTLNNRATSTYVNSTYASSAHMMTYEEALAITGNTSSTANDLRYIGLSGTTEINPNYYLATVVTSNGLAYVSNVGHINYYYDSSYGVRPVIVLKDGIKTTGKGTDAFGQDAWTLIAP